MPSTGTLSFLLSSLVRNVSTDNRVSIMLGKNENIFVKKAKTGFENRGGDLQVGILMSCVGV